MNPNDINICETLDSLIQ